jgi:hypothetical protein
LLPLGTKEQRFYATLGIKRKQPDTPHEQEQCSSRSKRSLSPGNLIKFELYSQLECVCGFTRQPELLSVLT